jgi:TolB-like protein/Tfp pilus assembly protein PilF
MIVAVEVDDPACAARPPSSSQALAQPQPALAENLVSQENSRERIPQALLHRRWPILLGISIDRFAVMLSIVLIAALGTYFAWSRSRTRPQLSSGRLMLAVLPFENLTGDAGQDYFSDGLTEEMISQFGRIAPERLGVIARTSVMHYKHTQEPLEQIGRELGVQYVLEGSVRRDADKVRISAQLIQMSDQTHLWARQYDRGMTSLLALQGEIAQEIADEIHLRLGGDHKQIATDSKPTSSPSSYEAYDLYLKGRYFWNKRTVQGFQQAILYFQQAVAKDPNYARAYAGLADSYALTSSYRFAPQNEFMPKARAAALRALQIDDSLAEAHTSLALITEIYDWDWQTAEREYRRAIQLDANYATAHQWYAEYLSFQGRFDEALQESERARQLDPLSLIIATDNGAILYYSRQYDRAIEQFRAVLEMEPSFPRAHFVLYAYVQKGRFADALADIENWRRTDDAPLTWAEEAYVYGRWGQPEHARRALKKFEELRQERHLDPGQGLLSAYLGMGDKDRVFAVLEKACAERSNVLATLRVEPNYDTLRSDPRFQDLLRRVGLAQ